MPRPNIAISTCEGNRSDAAARNFSIHLAGFSILLLSFSVLSGCTGATSSGGTPQKNPPPPSVSVAISPTSAPLLEGASQQFSATVTGTSNTAVNWTATGGTISATGLFVAGNSAGNFTVTATSAADASMSARHRSQSPRQDRSRAALPPAPRTESPGPSAARFLSANS